MYGKPPSSIKEKFEVSNILHFKGFELTALRKGNQS
jgi:hypothetical protein